MYVTLLSSFSTAHPNTKLFITHGGMFGVQESIYHGVPLIVLPIFEDQFDNARRIEDKGLGAVLWNKKGISEQAIKAKISAVLFGDQRYLLHSISLVTCQSIELASDSLFTRTKIR